MHQKILAIVMLFYSVLSWAAVNPNSNSQVLADNVYTQAKPNIVLDAKHAEFIIKLKSNPSTGYAWFLRGYNSDLLVPVKRTYQASSDKLIGASGFEVWVFKVKESGFIVPQQTQIRFVYMRPWSDVDNITQAFFRISTMPN